MSRSPSDRTLNDLANAVADEFKAYRHSDDFNELSLVIDNGARDRSTLIVHIDQEQAADLADRVEAVLRDHGAQTQRERHSDTDIRVLATLDWSGKQPSLAVMAERSYVSIGHLTPVLGVESA